MYRYLLSFLIILFSANCWANASPLGYWKTVDDVTGRVQSIIQIYQAPDRTLSGKIIKTFPKPGIPPLVYCKLCKGERKDKPLLGMTILHSLKPSDKDTWRDGEIVDPKTGNVYHCFIKLIDNGNKLVIRGFVLFHWLGRSQTWLHTNI